ncbi:MAG: hypothetical protein KDC53_20220, partial [Saprospiraceae bacterium]|nr:hypothetical protein [Saprospiraceae bacterium]
GLTFKCGQLTFCFFRLSLNSLMLDYWMGRIRVVLFWLILAVIKKECEYPEGYMISDSHKKNGGCFSKEKIEK